MEGESEMPMQTSSSVGGLPFTHAIVIDDEPEEITGLVKELEAHGVLVKSISSSTEAEKVLLSRPKVHFIVLDWWLNGSDSNEAQGLLDILRDAVFSPVIIYTNKPGDAGKIIEKSNLKRIIRIIDKKNLTYEAVFEEINEWISTNAELKILMGWSTEIERQLSESLWDLYNVDKGGMKYILTLMMENGKSPGPGQLNELLFRLLSRKVEENTSFIDEVGKDIELLTRGGMPPTVFDDEELKRIQNIHSFERYHKVPDHLPIFTGDIYKVEGGDYLIVVTPRCDFSGRRELKKILVLEAVSFEKYWEQRTEVKLRKERYFEVINNGLPSMQYLPYVWSCDDGLVCDFQNVYSIPAHAFNSKNMKNKLKRVARMDSPFIENLIQRMTAHTMRFGVRDLGSNECDRLYGLAIKKYVAETNEGAPTTPMQKARAVGKESGKAGSS